jgi:hypothetical protein
VKVKCWQVFFYEVGLSIVATLLDAEQVWVKGVYSGDGEGLPFIPAVFAVLSQAVTNIEAHYFDHGRWNHPLRNSPKWPNDQAQRPPPGDVLRLQQSG